MQPIFDETVSLVKIYAVPVRGRIDSAVNRVRVGYHAKT